jgi:hypothetical protein
MHVGRATSFDCQTLTHAPRDWIASMLVEVFQLGYCDATSQYTMAQLSGIQLWSLSNIGTQSGTVLVMPLCKGVIPCTYCDQTDALPISVSSCSAVTVDLVLVDLAGLAALAGLSARTLTSPFLASLLFSASLLATTKPASP